MAEHNVAQTLRIDNAGPVVNIWLDRPTSSNALNGIVMRELTAAFTQVATTRRPVACAPSSSAAAARRSAPAPTLPSCARWAATRGSRTVPTPRSSPRCCGRCSAARCRSSHASTATAMPAASASRRCATSASRSTAPPSASAKRARPAAGDDQPVRRSGDGRAGGAALVRHRRALRRRCGQAMRSRP